MLIDRFLTLQNKFRAFNVSARAKDRIVVSPSAGMAGVWQTSSATTGTKRTATDAATRVLSKTATNANGEMRLEATCVNWARQRSIVGAFHSSKHFGAMTLPLALKPDSKLRKPRSASRASPSSTCGKEMWAGATRAFVSHLLLYHAALLRPQGRAVEAVQSPCKAAT